MASRPRHLRENMGVFVSGKTGSGKSRMASRLASVWRRRVFIDPTDSFDADYQARDYEDAKTFLVKHWREPSFSLSCVFSKDVEYVKLFHALANLAFATKDSVANTLIVYDECDMWATAHKIDPRLSRLLRYGRHWGLSWVATCRADSQTNRDIRTNAQAIIVFRQGMLSSDLRKELKEASSLRDSDEIIISRLRLHDRHEAHEAVEDVHFVCLPDRFEDVLGRWNRIARSKPPKQE